MLAAKQRQSRSVTDGRPLRIITFKSQRFWTKSRRRSSSIRIQISGPRESILSGVVVQPRLRTRKRSAGQFRLPIASTTATATGLGKEPFTWKIWLGRQDRRCILDRAIIGRDWYGYASRTGPAEYHSYFADGWEP